jgi:hypothetical protein
MVKFRKVTDADKPEVQAWIDADASHRGKIEPEFYLTQGKHHAVYAVGDEEGTVMYVRHEAEGSKIRMHIQFCTDRRRIMKAMREGFPLIKNDAKTRGFTGIVFYTHSPALVKFVVGELGFRADCEAVL